MHHGENNAPSSGLGRPRLSKLELRKKNDARAELMKNARISRNVTRSRQPCQLKDNQLVLTRLLEGTSTNNTNGIKVNKLSGLLAVIRSLQSEHIDLDGKELDNSFMPFDEALELYYAYLGKQPPFCNTDKDSFMYAILHDKWGLCVYVVFIEALNQRFVVLRPDSFDIGNFLDMVTTIKTRPNDLTEEKLVLDAEKVKYIMCTMDTEWDRKVARVFLSANRSRKQLEDLGIDSDKTSTDIQKVCYSLINY